MIGRADHVAIQLRGLLAVAGDGAVPDSEDGLRFLFALEEVGLAHNVLHPWR